MRIRFWGVRGSTPTPQLENLRYGGNTPCIEVRIGSHIYIFDCGTGLRSLGKSLLAEFGEQPIYAHVFLSHFHWDHIQGIPFFQPLYENPDNYFFFHSSSRNRGLQRTIEEQMADPYFPVDMTEMAAHRNFYDIEEDKIAFDNCTVQSMWLNHPQGCLGCRLQAKEGVLVYATDNEPGNPRADHNLRELARGADALIYDAQFSREDLGEEKKGWGHSSWEEGVAICKEVGVKQFILFHHDPDRNDVAVDQLEKKAQASFQRSRAAFEGMTLKF